MNHNLRQQTMAALLVRALGASGSGSTSPRRTVTVTVTVTLPRQRVMMLDRHNTLGSFGLQQNATGGHPKL
jgi:hypothetical protein